MVGDRSVSGAGDDAFDVKQVLSVRDLRDAREQVAFLPIVWILIRDASRAGLSRAASRSRSSTYRSETRWDSANTSTVRNSSHRSAWCSKAQGLERWRLARAVATRLVVPSPKLRTLWRRTTSDRDPCAETRS